MSIMRVCIALTAAVVMPVAGVTAPASTVGSSTAGPVTAGLTVTPSITVVGGQVIVVATATNISLAPVAASLGLDDYQYADQVFTGVRGTPGCTPRNLHRLIYYGVQSLAPGATAGSAASSALVPLSAVTHRDVRRCTALPCRWRHTPRTFQTTSLESLTHISKGDQPGSRALGP
jgi:hypothetical protein